jgi:hypothetical protein
LNLRIGSHLFCSLSICLLAACSKEPSGTGSGFDSRCPAPAGVVLTRAQVDTAISGLKDLLAGKLSFNADPAIVQILTDSPRADLILASLLCTAQKSEAITTTDTTRLEYAKKLFLYTWATSPAPGPEDVEAWTVSHPFSHVTPDPTPSNENVAFAAEHFDSIAPTSDTCTRETIPAGTSVCVRLTGKMAVGLYATEAKNHQVGLTSVRAGEAVTWFKQNIDYAVCVRSTSEAPEGTGSPEPVAIQIDGATRQECLGTPARN